MTECVNCDRCAELRREIEEDLERLEDAKRDMMRSRYGAPEELLASDGTCASIGLGSNDPAGLTAMDQYVKANGRPSAFYPGMAGVNQVNPVSGAEWIDNLGPDLAGQVDGYDSPGNLGWTDMDGNPDPEGGFMTRPQGIPWCRSENDYLSAASQLDAKVDEYEELDCEPAFTRSQMRRLRRAIDEVPTPMEHAQHRAERQGNVLRWAAGKLIPGMGHVNDAVSISNF